jgi:flavin reductase (DIM6/NTAB) family NADH-FMN oxidoreductase RutF
MRRCVCLWSLLIVRSVTVDIDLNELSPGQIYATMTQALIPRPIAWVLSENESGSYNLAPFSYFTGISSRPPLLMLSIGKKPDGAPKDTLANIQARRDFVVHIAHSGQIEPLNNSAAVYGAGVSEVDELGLELAELKGSRLPRLAECRLAMACELHEIVEMGEVPQALIFGRINSIYVDDAVGETDAKGRFKINASKLDPLGRLGVGEYSGFGEVIPLGSPTLEKKGA